MIPGQFKYFKKILTSNQTSEWRGNIFTPFWFNMCNHEESKFFHFHVQQAIEHQSTTIVTYLPFVFWI